MYLRISGLLENLTSLNLNLRPIYLKKSCIAPIGQIYPQKNLPIKNEAATIPKVKEILLENPFHL
jgi:hypothetical protein